METETTEAVDLAPLIRLINRLSKLGINIECVGNYPWIYLHKVGDKRVTEKYDSEHAFTIGYLPVSVDRPFRFTDITEIFRVIRKYAVPERKVIVEKYSA